MEAIKEFLTEKYGGAYVSNHFPIDSETFAVAIHNNEVTVWGRGGVVSLGHTTGSLEEVIAFAIERIDMYRQGYIFCSDCGRPVQRSAIAGNFFAGQYCNTCWHTKWKFINAAENYD